MSTAFDRHERIRTPALPNRQRRLLGIDFVAAPTPGLASTDDLNATDLPEAVSKRFVAKKTEDVVFTQDTDKRILLDGLSNQLDAQRGEMGWDPGSGPFGTALVGSAYPGCAWERSPRLLDLVMCFHFFVPGTYAPSFTVAKQTPEFDDNAVPAPCFDVSGCPHQEFCAPGFSI